MKKELTLELEENKKNIINDLQLHGADCAKFISRRIGTELKLTMTLLEELVSLGWLQKVSGTFLNKKSLKKPKHMNHTYYELTREARLFIRHNNFR